MPVKKLKAVKESNTSLTSSSKFSNLANLFSKINVIWILIILLIIGAFLIGVLFTKVQYLENGFSGTTNVGSQNAGDEFGQPQAPTGPVDVAVGHLPPLGDEDAPVTLIEFSDFECPFCGALFNETLPQIKAEYIDTGKVKFYYRHFPLTSIHPNAEISALASECANDQGKFWDYHDLLFENQNEWIPLSGDAVNEKLGEYAGRIGLNTGEFNECVTSQKFIENVNNDLNDGTSAGVDGTPGVFINGYLTVGAVPFEQFKAEIEARLAE
jgi:protein-disulfide isomerase